MKFFRSSSQQNNWWRTQVTTVWTMIQPDKENNVSKDLHKWEYRETLEALVVVTKFKKLKICSQMGAVVIHRLRLTSIQTTCSCCPIQVTKAVIQAMRIMKTELDKARTSTSMTWVSAKSVGWPSCKESINWQSIQTELPIKPIQEVTEDILFPIRATWMTTKTWFQ